jgi:3',5'-cyclic AMP phosphodiesterase CpdA
MPRLFAISDLHLSYPAARTALANLQAFPDDWLILAGDVGDSPEQISSGFRQLAEKFAQVVWAPGNHDLWSVPGTPRELRGLSLYDHLVRLARSCGIVTPEDPYPVFGHETGPLTLVPMFLLYDYSFRPVQLSLNDVIAWAAERSCVCSDEILLQPDPYPTRADWCHARVRTTLSRLETLDRRVETVLINHFALEEEHAVLPQVPRFTPWSGTKLTKAWHRRFRARAVIFGHLHIPGVRWLDGVPFQEVSLGYPSQWGSEHAEGIRLREVLLAPRRQDA